MTSTDILRALMSFELDAGITYIDNEPLGHVRTHAIGKEEYVLVTPADSPLAGRPTVTWRSRRCRCVCRDMQNRRIIQTIFESVGARPNPRIETNSMISKYLLPARRLLVDHYAAKFRRVAGASGGTARRTDHRAQYRQDGGLVIADRSPIPPLLLGFWGHVERESPLVRLEDTAAIRI